MEWVEDTVRSLAVPPWVGGGYHSQSWAESSKLSDGSGDLTARVMLCYLVYLLA